LLDWIYNYRHMYIPLYRHLDIHTSTHPRLTYVGMHMGWPVLVVWP
jgi:hypothetical protein